MSCFRSLLCILRRSERGHVVRTLPRAALLQQDVPGDALGREPQEGVQLELQVADCAAGQAHGDSGLK